MKRKTYIDFLRIIASFFVIFNHTVDKGFFLFAHYGTDKIQFWVYLIISIFCRFSVPVFIMISGTLLLNDKSNNSIRKCLTKAKYYIILLLFWSLFYYLVDLVHRQDNINIYNFVVAFYSSNLKYHLWYLYFYIGFLIILPFLMVLKDMPLSRYIYLYILGVIINGIVPIFSYFVMGGAVLNLDLNINWIVNIVLLYPLIGYFLDYFISSKYICCINIVNIASLFFTAFVTYKKGLIEGVYTLDQSQTFYDCFVILNSSSIFISIKYIFNKIRMSEFILNLIHNIGRYTFGVYLLHVFVLENVYSWDLLSVLQGFGLNLMLSAFLMCLWVFLISLLFTFIMSKLPLVRALVGIRI